MASSAPAWEPAVKLFWNYQTVSPRTPANTGGQSRGSPHGSLRRGSCGEVGDHPEMVARPHAALGLVEEALAGDDVERGPVLDAAHHDVVDPAAQLPRPLAAGYERVSRRESVAGIFRVGALPGVPVTDARTVQRLAAGPEAHAGGVGGGVEVAGQDHMVHLSLLHQLFDEARGRHGLQLALALEAKLPRGVVVG